GDEWKVIIDKDAIKDGKKLNDFKWQLRHEMRHLEFESNEGLKDEWVKAFTRHEDWPKIATAFVEAHPAKKPPTFPKGKDKAAYTVADWQPEDMVGEIYAMELGRENWPKDSPKAELNRFITASGIPLLLAGFDKKRADEVTKGYEEGEFHGAEEGAAPVSETPGAPPTFDTESTGQLNLEAKGSYENYQEKIDENEKLLDEMIHSEYTGYVPGASSLLKTMQEFNRQTRELNEEYKKSGNEFYDEKIKERVKKVKVDIGELTIKLSQIAGGIPNKTMNPFRQIWNATSFIAIDDWIQAGKDLVEFFQRRHTRKKGDHSGRIGKALFGNSFIGHEFTARQQKAEQEEVNEWKTRYESMDAWRLQELIDQMADAVDPNKDKLKAILRILADKGRIDWRNEKLWMVLNKLQSATHLTPGDPILLHNPPLLRQKLHTATGQIWEDYDEFPSLERKNEDSYDGGVKKFIPSYDRIQDQLTDRFEQLLRLHRNGQNVDPQEYEAIAVYAIEKGKSDGEAVLFYLLAGMIDGLLTPDRGMALDHYLNQWPATQWIYNQKPPLSRNDLERWAKKYFPDDLKRGIRGWQFKNFYWTVVQNDPMTVQRVRKSVSERSWDHDWSRHIAPIGDGHTAKRFLQGASGHEEAKDTGVENAMVGALMWLEENARAMNKIDFRKHFSREMGWIAMTDGILENVAFKSGAGATPFTRMTAGIENAFAREGGMGHHGEWTVGQHRNKMRDFLDRFDPMLFRMLRNKQAALDNKAHGANVIAYLKSRYPEQTATWNAMGTLDDVFDQIDFIVQVVTSNVSDEQFRSHINWLLQGIPNEGY
ncbi:MAG: hypothetical protein V1760_03360, partial [Candidatus Peregrinibacteria bacterium]